jgi:mRNA interferase RelE/StbE
MYQIRTDPKFDKQIQKINRSISKQIQSWIENNLENTTAPRRQGKPLTGTKKGLWRYRIGDYRIITQIKDKQLIILCLSVGHRREIYK